ncbi:DUF2332 domain-containing protein [Rhodococcus artemisiae]|uniref:DUF2332 domain-containing protein n=1 Tax=Rhodococcus artemisiae TaxID=714159 RepID=A0ABU7L3D3_9NOCA|nr:DUF2332 domain-containing protein [Rhodococcus artemisiae]MEE2056063.1 DUF2332 domain-containing protein [Rhodococcus artemisiae]
MSTRERYQRFAELEAHGISPTYELLCSGIADDSEIVEHIERLPESKRQPNLVLGASRHLGAPTDSYSSFRRWTLDNWAAVERTALAHSTQTNEAGRAAVLLPILGLLDGPLWLIEVGASAGLCLYPDRYSYLYDGHHAVHPDDGPSPVVLSCTTTGEPPIPRRLPTIAFRAGLDLNPLDVTNEDDMSWLDSLIWPEHHTRRENLRAAAAIAGADRPHLVRGDLNTAVADLVDQAPTGTTVVVFHSAVLNYVDPEERAAFEQTVRALPCHWISNESPRVLPGITRLLGVPLGEIGGRFVLGLDGRPVALTGAHGQSLDWVR